MGLRSFALLMMIVINLPHGPDESDMRWQQLKAVLGEHFQRQSHSSSPLFQHYLLDMLKERRGEIEQVDGMTEEAALWSLLQAESHMRKKGHKCNVGRFMSVVYDGQGLAKKWFSTLFECSVAALDLDVVVTAALPRIRLQTEGPTRPRTRPPRTRRRSASETGH